MGAKWKIKIGRLMKFCLHIFFAFLVTCGESRRDKEATRGAVQIPDDCPDIVHQRLKTK